MSECRFCGEDAGELTWCSTECAALDVDERVPTADLLAERERIVARLMAKSHWPVAEEAALIGQIRVLDQLVKMRGGRVPTRATPPGAWHWSWDHQPECVEQDAEVVPLELVYAEREDDAE